MKTVIAALMLLAGTATGFSGKRPLWKMNPVVGAASVTACISHSTTLRRATGDRKSTRLNSSHT